MNIRTLAIAVSLIAASSAHAIGCDVSEYAQLKDKAKTKEGRQNLAEDYCLYRNLREIRPGTTYSETCRIEMAKILDALSAAKATTTVNYAIGGCEGAAPKAGSK